MMLMALMLTGCVTQKVDWNGRVGNYTYDQAVMELGPPDRCAKLTDGMVVADWLTQHAQMVFAPEPYFAQPGIFFGPLTPMPTETYFPAQYLRLTFGTDGKLKTWKELAR